jgi:hypothetical protein
MAQLYREVVLKEKPATSNEGGFIPLGAITAATAPANGNGNGAAKERLKKLASRWRETDVARFQEFQGPGRSKKSGPLF